MLKRIQLPFLLCFALMASTSVKCQQQMMLPSQTVEMKMLSYQNTAPVAGAPANRAQHRMATINPAVPFQPVTYGLADNANPNAPAPQISTEALTMRSVAAGAGLVGLLAGGRINTKFNLTPKMKIFGGVGWGDKVCNVGIIF